MTRGSRIRGLLAGAAGCLAVVGVAASASAASTAHTRATPDRLPLSASRLAADERGHQAAARQTTTITGVVRDASGKALAGVCVTAFGAASHRSGFTGANGRYVIGGLRAGSYAIEYRACAAAGGYLTQWSGGARSQATASRVQVGGQLVQPVSAVTMRTFSRPAAGPMTSPIAQARRMLGLPDSPAAGQLTTKSRGRIAGQVTDRAGQPIKGICVVALSRNAEEARLVVTDKSGFYRTGKTRSGRYEVVFEPGCGNKGNWIAQVYRNSENPAKYKAVTVAVGRTTSGIDARLRPGGEISGTVTGPAGRKLSDVCILSASVRDRPIYQFTPIGLSKRGSYHVHGMPPGRYRVQFTPCSVDSPYLAVWWRDAATERGAKVITVRSGHPVSGIDQVLPLGGKITGTVTDASGTPLSGMCVYGLTGKDADNLVALAETGADGRYTLEALPTGTYQVQVTPGCLNNGNYLSTSTPDDIAVTAGQTTAGVNITMRSAGEVAGTVTNLSGRPIQGICVTVSGGPDGNYGNEVWTAANGSYSVKQLLKGTYTANFAGGCGSKGSYAPQAWQDTNFDTPTPIQVGTGQDVTGISAVMQPGATITGRVTNSAGQGLRNACIVAGPSVLMQESGGALADGLAFSGRGGTYRAANLPPGQDDLSFTDCSLRGPDYAAQWYRAKPYPIGASAVWAGAGITTSGIDAVLPAGGALGGQIRTAAGRHPAGICLDATDLRTGYQLPGFGVLFVGGTVTGYTLSHQLPGPYQIAFGGSCVGLNFATQWYRDSATRRGAARVVIRANHTTTGISSALVKGGTIAGHVTAAGSATPLSNVCVFAQDPSQYYFYGFGRTNKHGFYRVVGLNTGSYELSFSPCNSGGADNAADLVLPKVAHVRTGQPTTGVDASLAAGGTVAGTVSGGTPVAGLPNICVQATGVNVDAASETSTAGDGSYQLQNLPQGSYLVSFAAQPYCDDSGLFAPQNYKAPVSVTAGGTTSAVDVTLGADGTISGTVANTHGSKLAGVCVTAFGPTGPVVATTSAGRYTIGGLLPGRYRVRFSAGCGRSGLRTQWWQHAPTRSKAKVLRITAGLNLAMINAIMHG